MGAVWRKRRDGCPRDRRAGLARRRRQAGRDDNINSNGGRSLSGARPEEQKKGADHASTAKILFRDDPKSTKPEQVIIQVKGR